jgi:hypothetical protein
MKQTLITSASLSPVPVVPNSASPLPTSVSYYQLIVLLDVKDVDDHVCAHNGRIDNALMLMVEIVFYDEHLLRQLLFDEAFLYVRQFQKTKTCNTALFLQF